MVRSYHLFITKRPEWDVYLGPCSDNVHSYVPSITRGVGVVRVLVIDYYTSSDKLEATLY